MQLVKIVVSFSKTRGASQPTVATISAAVLASDNAVDIAMEAENHRGDGQRGDFLPSSAPDEPVMSEDLNPIDITFSHSNAPCTLTPDE